MFCRHQVEEVKEMVEAETYTRRVKEVMEMVEVETYGQMEGWELVYKSRWWKWGWRWWSLLHIRWRRRW